MSDMNPLKPDFHFNWRDILSAPASALRLKKIFLGALSLLAALLIYNIFTYLAVWASGGSASYLFGAEDIFPFSDVRIDAGPARILYGFGIGASIFCVMFGMLAISLINIEELRGHRLASATDGLRFAFWRIRELFYAELSLMALILFLVALLAGLGLAIKIPYVGESLFALLFLFPGFPIGLFLTLVILVMLASFFILPAAVSVDKKGETFTCLLETFSTLMRQPFRWVGYTVASLLSGKLCVWILAGISVISIDLIVATTARFDLNGAASLYRDGLSHLPFHSWLVQFTLQLVPGVDTPFDFSARAVFPFIPKFTNDSFGSYVMSGSILLIFSYIWGYGVSIIATSQSYAYVIIRKLRDDYDVTAEDPLYLQKEWMNPPIDEQFPEKRDTGDEPNDSTQVADDRLDDNEI
ncbi:hypothetical protein JYT16_00455 [Gemmatimonas aurantiaca]|nr:hypothetical protein [Gemmatimonas aurantiaca]